MSLFDIYVPVTFPRRHKTRRTWIIQDTFFCKRHYDRSQLQLALDRVYPSGNYQLNIISTDIYATMICKHNLFYLNILLGIGMSFGVS